MGGGAVQPQRKEPDPEPQPLATAIPDSLPEPDVETREQPIFRRQRISQKERGRDALGIGSYHPWKGR